MYLIKHVSRQCMQQWKFLNMSSKSVELVREIFMRSKNAFVSGIAIIALVFSVSGHIYSSKIVKISIEFKVAICEEFRINDISNKLQNLF